MYRSLQLARAVALPTHCTLPVGSDVQNLFTELNGRKYELMQLKISTHLCFNN